MEMLNNSFVAYLAKEASQKRMVQAYGTGGRKLQGVSVPEDDYAATPQPSPTRQPVKSTDDTRYLQGVTVDPNSRYRDLGFRDKAHAKEVYKRYKQMYNDELGAIGGNRMDAREGALKAVRQEMSLDKNLSVEGAAALLKRLCNDEAKYNQQQADSYKEYLETDRFANKADYPDYNFNESQHDLRRYEDIRNGNYTVGATGSALDREATKSILYPRQGVANSNSAISDFSDVGYYNQRSGTYTNTNQIRNNIRNKQQPQRTTVSKINPATGRPYSARDMHYNPNQYRGRYYR